MKFQIEKLIVWPNDAAFERSEVTFQPNAVNVITGDSRTGKSAIVGIIDYCMGSGECSIPIGVVRANASWYGIVAQTDEGRILFARKNPNANEKASEASLIKDIRSDEDIPDTISEEDAKENSDDIVRRLTTLSRITDVKRDEKGATNEKLSFRDLAHLLFQVQDIMTNRFMLFYKLHISYSRDKLREWFNFIIGAETLNDVLKRKELKDLKASLDSLVERHNFAKASANRFIASIRDYIIKAAGFGLCCKDGNVPTDHAQLIAIARDIANLKEGTLPKTTADSLKLVRAEIRALKNRTTAIDTELHRLSRDINEFEDLIDTLSQYNDANAKKHEHLKISEWMRANWTPTGRCTGSGEAGFADAQAEVDKICSVVSACEAAMTSARENNPENFAEYQKLQARSRELTSEFQENQRQIANLEGEKETLKSENMNQLIGQIRQIIKTADDLEDANGILKQIEELKTKIDEIQRAFNEAAIKQRARGKVDALQGIALSRLKTLDCEDEYRVNPPIFEKNDMNVFVCDSAGKRHPLSEVGSASNWVAMHIAFSCAFQEFFAAMREPSSYVPNFMVFDQPSQVYFPSLSKDNLAKIDTALLEDMRKRLDAIKLTGNDRESVRKIFETLAQSVKESGGAWQAIVLEHAGDDIYGGIELVTERANWHDGKGALIPKKWYADKTPSPQTGTQANNHGEAV